MGKIDSVEDGQATITLTSGKRLRVPVSGLRGNADGTVTIGYTADQLEALVDGAASSTTGK